MSDATLSKIARLLRSDSAEKQMAAAVVLAELRPRDANVLEGLTALLDSEVPALQRHAVVALAAIGSPRLLPRALGFVTSRDESLRLAAMDAVAGFGDGALKLVRERLATAAPAERRALEEILGRLGSKDALGTLLSGLDRNDVEAARAAALSLRQRIKDADARGRRRYLDQAAQFLESKAAKASPPARVAALKVLGFVEDRAAVPALLRHAVSPDEPDTVRHEAIIALRLVTAGRGVDARLSETLIGLAEKAPLGVARVALYTFAGSKLSPAMTRRLEKLGRHSDGERALLAIDLLGQAEDEEASAALSRLLLQTTVRARAEAAAQGLTKRKDAAQALGRALLAAPDRDRAQMVAALLRPRIGSLDARLARQIAAAAAGQLETQQVPPPDVSAEPLLQIARLADPALVADKLRALAGRLGRRKKTDAALRVLRVVGQGSRALPSDGYALGALELTHGRKEEAFTIFGQLLERGFDVAAAMRRDRSLAPEHRYQVGFHFAERGHQLGEELLTAVAEAGGRTKLGKMARAKLKSSGF